VPRIDFRRDAALLLIVLTGLFGCTDQSEPAKQAIMNVEQTVEAAGEDAQRYVPEDYRNVNDQLTTLKAQFNQRDYAGVLAKAPGVLTQAQALRAATDKAKQDEAAQEAAAQQAAQDALKSEWDDLNGAVPESITAIEARVEELSKAKKLPGNVPRSALDSARSNLADAKTLWQQASDTQSNGQLQDAVNVARQAQEKTNAAKVDLGMSSTA